MNLGQRKKLNEWLITIPSLAWLTFLFLMPTLIVFAIAFKPADLYGGIGSGWSLDTLRSLINPNYPAIIWRTLYISLLTTLLSIVLATPLDTASPGFPPDGGKFSCCWSLSRFGPAF